LKFEIYIIFLLILEKMSSLILDIKSFIEIKD